MAFIVTKDQEFHVTEQLFALNGLPKQSYPK